jgi:hypothetical protein
MLDPLVRIRSAAAQRYDSDYIFTGAGLNIFLTIITCGIFGFFLFYQLMRRDRDHNRRRFELLDATNTYAWNQANERGLADELRPAFERVALALATLQRQTTEFRDPTIWLVIDIVAAGVRLVGVGVAEVVGFVLIDSDLDTHDRAEYAAEADLAQIYARLGVALPAADPNRVKGKQNYGGRIVASIFTCGIYLFWWLYDMQVEGNRHVEGNWPFEDALVAGLATA